MPNANLTSIQFLKMSFLKHTQGQVVSSNCANGINSLILNKKFFLLQINEGGGDESEDDDDDDSDDDGFKITIDKNKIEEAKTSNQTFGLNKPVVRTAPVEKKGKFSVEEFDQIGAINGQVSVEYDLESIEDKPWRQPGNF